MNLVNISCILDDGFYTNCSYFTSSIVEQGVFESGSASHRILDDSSIIKNLGEEYVNSFGYSLSIVFKELIFNFIFVILLLFSASLVIGILWRFGHSCFELYVLHQRAIRRESTLSAIPDGSLDD
jgi:hypothetical protein